MNDEKGKRIGVRRSLAVGTIRDTLMCASTRMNQNDAVVKPAHVELLHVCSRRASRFRTAQELRLGKRVHLRASARA